MKCLTRGVMPFGCRRRDQLREHARNGHVRHISLFPASFENPCVIICVTRIASAVKRMGQGRVLAARPGSLPQNASTPTFVRGTEWVHSIRDTNALREHDTMTEGNRFRPKEGRRDQGRQLAHHHRIAECGAAHAYIEAVAATGADAVKFQTHIAAGESSPSEQKTEVFVAGKLQRLLQAGVI